MPKTASDYLDELEKQVTVIGIFHQNSSASFSKSFENWEIASIIGKKWLVEGYQDQELDQVIFVSKLGAVVNSYINTEDIPNEPNS